MTKQRGENHQTKHGLNHDPHEKNNKTTDPS